MQRRFRQGRGLRRRDRPARQRGGGRHRGLFPQPFDQSRPELQGSGLGSALQQRLKKFAVDRGVRGFVAEVLEANAAMLNLARRLGNIELKSEDGTYHVTALFA